ncbi:MAG TPA: hypothetical protein VL137_16805 [Polyangiaceae bacterium]|nr:hypothetical protein [Polyangiaceae bacterium]
MDAGSSASSCDDALQFGKRLFPFNPNYQPYTLPELIDRSELVLTARIESVGSNVPFGSQSTASTFIVSIEFRAVTVLKGNATSVLVTFGNQTLASSEWILGCSSFPQAPFLLFLAPRSTSSDAYQLAGLEGMVAQGNGALIPVAVPDSQTFVGGPTTFQEFIAQFGMGFSVDAGSPPVGTLPDAAFSIDAALTPDAGFFLDASQPHPG